MSNTPSARSSPPEGAVRETAVRFADAYDARDVDAVVGVFAENGDWTWYVNCHPVRETRSQP